eukprot:COSAG05_NODE_456_length_9625_cov_17.941214_3_plen_269_part_00
MPCRAYCVEMEAERRCGAISSALSHSLEPEPEPAGRLPSDLILLHVGGTAPSARALDWVRLFHSGLMVDNFSGDELEPVDEWIGMLQSDAEERMGIGCLDEREVTAGFDQTVPYEIEFHLFMLAHGTFPETTDADGLPLTTGATVVAGACCEIYMNSSVGLLTYLVTHASQRGRGLARRLCDEVRRTVRAQSPRGLDSLLMLECHRNRPTDPSVGRSVGRSAVGRRLQAEIPRPAWLSQRSCSAESLGPLGRSGVTSAVSCLLRGNGS